MTVPSNVPCGPQRTSAGGMRYVTESSDDKQRSNRKFQKLMAEKAEKFYFLFFNAYQTFLLLTFTLTTETFIYFLKREIL